MEIAPATKSEPKSKRSVFTDCPLTAALTAIGGKRSLICLYWLDSGMQRFNELRRLMPDISHKVLSATLRNLEREGLICRTVHAEVPPRVEYSISSHGETVRPLIQAVRIWGREHVEWKREGAEINEADRDGQRKATPAARPRRRATARRPSGS